MDEVYRATTPRQPSEWVYWNFFHALWYYYRGKTEEADLLVTSALWWSQQKSEQERRQEVLTNLTQV